MPRSSASDNSKRTAKMLAKARAEAIEAMNKETAKKLEKIEKAIGNTRERNLRYYYENLGKELLEIEEHTEKYTPFGLQQILTALATQERVLRKSKQFARDWSEEMLEYLIQAKNEETGYQLNWGHVTYLLRLETDAERRRWIDRAIAKSLDPAAMHKLMQQKEGTRGAGGRPHKLPQSVHGQIRQVRDFTEKWAFKAEHVWNGNESNVFQNVLSEPAEELEDVDLENLDALIEMLPRLREHAAAIRGAAVEARRRVKEVLDARDAAEKSRQEEAERQAALESGTGKASRAIVLDSRRPAGSSLGSTGRKRRRVAG